MHGSRTADCAVFLSQRAQGTDRALQNSKLVLGCDLGDDGQRSFVHPQLTINLVVLRERELLRHPPELLENLGVLFVPGRRLSKTIESPTRAALGQLYLAQHVIALG